MPSIIPGYEYDIFISYRQNDDRPKTSFFVVAILLLLACDNSEELIPPIPPGCDAFISCCLVLVDYYP